MQFEESGGVHQQFGGLFLKMNLTSVWLEYDFGVGKVTLQGLDILWVYGIAKKHDLL